MISYAKNNENLHFIKNRNHRDRPPWRHWFVTFVSAGFPTDYLRDANVRYTNKVHLLRRCCLFRFSCSAHGYTCEGNAAVEQVRKRGCTGCTGCSRNAARIGRSVTGVGAVRVLHARAQFPQIAHRIAGTNNPLSFEVLFLLHVYVQFWNVNELSSPPIYVLRFYVSCELWEKKAIASLHPILASWYSLPNDNPI